MFCKCFILRVTTVFVLVSAVLDSKVFSVSFSLSLQPQRRTSRFLFASGRL